jgi:hypothetical protein
MFALCQQLTLSACPDLLSNLLDVRQLPHLVEERLGWGVGAEHDFEATFGIGRRPLSARSGQMHRSKQHPRWQAGVWTSEAERRRPPSDLPERCRRRRVIAMTARAVGPGRILAWPFPSRKRLAEGLINQEAETA